MCKFLAKRAFISFKTWLSTPVEPEPTLFASVSRVVRRRDQIAQHVYSKKVRRVNLRHERLLKRLENPVTMLVRYRKIGIELDEYVTVGEALSLGIYSLLR
jgi:hypothetical protein